MQFENSKYRTELIESRNRYADLYDFAPVGYVTFDHKGCIQEINLTGANMVGAERTQLIGVPMCFIVNKSDFKIFLDHLRCCKQTDEQVTSELSITKRNGKPIDIQLLSAPIRNADGLTTQYRSIMTDITERKQLEKELLRLERLNLIGEMAAAIAHEVRNPMTTVRGFLQLFKSKSEYIQDKEHLNLMTEELDRANSIISEFLSLAKNGTTDMKDQNLNDIIKAIYPLLKADAIITDKNIKLDLEDIPSLLVDEKEIHQIILNLVNNGLQAMSSGATLTVKTFVDHEVVVLAVQDQGDEIPPELVEKLGTPFFTTKDNGTGLGLAVCYSIAARHNAAINLTTGPSGTTFYIRFKIPKSGKKRNGKTLSKSKEKGLSHK
ncbi:MAG: PAS domain-containing sensor histidine kinase [Firmicutes bacterium HGW-Firmicutes-8]|nr:MAG: PAS domain-containing sensor histidine kinase [Firmicutes bacterium HGW-Firmicutes-8]